MLHQSQLAPATAELIGDLQPLIDQLGSAAGLAALASANGYTTPGGISNASDLHSFLQNHHATILQPLELPAIQRAFNHAARNELRELIAFDRELAAEPLLQTFASASKRVGQNQLLRLRPLRDHRLVQRYLTAVEHGEANGWHTLVYGLTLSVYSLPLRQGLCGYSRQTTHGFIQSAARSLQLSETARAELFDNLSTGIPSAVESILAPNILA